MNIILPKSVNSSPLALLRVSEVQSIFYFGATVPLTLEKTSSRTTKVVNGIYLLGSYI